MQSMQIVEVEVEIVKKVITYERLSDTDYDEGFTLFKDRAGNFYVRHWSGFEDGCCPVTGGYESCSDCVYYSRNHDVCDFPGVVILKYEHPILKKVVEVYGSQATAWELQKAGIKID